MKRRNFIAMRRRDFLIASTVGFLTAVAPLALAQESSKPARVGYVTGASNDSVGGNDILNGLRQGLAGKGYVEGRNLVLIERFGERHTDRFPAMVAELLAVPVDVLVTVGTPAALVAQRQTRTVPIVILSGDPVGVGLVASLARPGGNITGVSTLASEYSAKWLELLKEAVPRLHHVAVLFNPDNPVQVEELERMRQVAPGLGLELAPFGPKDMEASLAAIAGAGADGLVITDDQSLGPAPRLAAFAAEQRLPAISGVGPHVRQGVLMSYSFDFFSMGRHQARFVERLLKGAGPADLPVEQETEFKLRINLKTAKALGLTIPPSVLARADEVIE